MSTWKADGCVGTVRLLPGEASELVAGIVEGLTHLAARAYVAGARRLVYTSHQAARADSLFAPMPDQHVVAGGVTDQQNGHAGFVEDAGSQHVVGRRHTRPVCRS